MTAHIIVLSRPDPAKAEGAKKGADSVQPLLKAAGIIPKLRAPVAERLASKSDLATVLAPEFPDQAATKGFFDQQAYQDLIPLRDNSFLQMEIHILGA